MDSLLPQLEDLSSTIDDLESALQPIISSALSASTSKLPLLDKAKLYVLATYAIESILFSYLRLNGTDAKAHPVFQELNRVREYFNKIKAAEDVGVDGRSKSAPRLDRPAVNRFIRAGLTGNDRYDKERAAKRESEKAGAKRKLEEISVGTHTRFDGAAKRARADEGEQVNVVKAEDLEDDEEAEDDEDATVEPASWSEDVASRVSSGPNETPSDSVQESRRSGKKERREAKKPLEGDGDASSEQQAELLSAVKAKSPHDMPEDERKRLEKLKKKQKKRAKSKGQRLEDQRANEMK